MAKVGIVMGSDSDMPVMAKAADILEQLGISYEMTIISAHREPDVFFEYAKTAEEKGFKVIIAGAGMAAHLPGMCAAIFPMPVIGIPMHTTSLGGRDSLYSIVQMPSGIPVATVAINGGKNAGILAAKILAASDPELLEKLAGCCQEMLVHAVNVEGTRSGVDIRLIEMLAQMSEVPVTYAGGIGSMEDLEQIRIKGQGRVHFTVGSALDLFGGSLSFEKVVECAAGK